MSRFADLNDLVNDNDKDLVIPYSRTKNRWSIKNKKNKSYSLDNSILLSYE